MGAVQVETMATCPSCRSGNGTPRHRVGTDVYVGCATCGAAWLVDDDPFDANSVFDDGYFVDGVDRGGYPDYDADAQLHRRNAVERVQRLSRHLPGRRQPTLVDVGCASGYVLDAAAEAGWTVRGMDVSAWAREQVRHRGHEAFDSLGDALAGDPRPDAVAFFQSLEHLADPDEAVAMSLAALPAGGIVVVETWDADSTVARLSGSRWQQVNPPTVRHLFTRRSLTRMFERHGGHVVEARATSKSVSPRLVAGVVAHRAPVLGGPLLKLTEGRLGSVGVRYRLGDLVTVVAVKRASRP